MLDEYIVKIRREIKYLEVTMDKHLHFGKHVDAVCNKASKTVAALKRLYPRMDGLSQSKRVLLESVTQLIVLYAAAL